MTTPTTSARLREAVALLVEHNKWRRGEDDSSMPSGGPNPRLLGQAIDTVAQLVPELIANPAIDVTDEMVEAAIYQLDMTYPESHYYMRKAILAALQAVKS